MFKFVCKDCGSNFRITDDVIEIVCRNCGAQYERQGCVARLKTKATLDTSEIQEDIVIGLMRP